jgi:hypothetical protein
MSRAIHWRGAQVKRELRAFLAPRVRSASLYVTGYVRMRLAENTGSVVPFVASSPGEYPYLWDGTLRDSVQYAADANPLRGWIVSDAVDKHVHPGHHFSADEEFGHFWDGWAWDFQTGKIVKVAPPHEVAPRPFLRRGLAECASAVLQIISRGA